MSHDCDVCRGNRRIRVPRWRELECAMTPAEEMVSLDQSYREFDCPQCVPMVPYRRVRAHKLISEYDVDYAQRFQQPIQRSLAAAFGEYLLRKGLISFTTDDSDRLASGKIKIVAEMGAVLTKDAEKAGASVDAVETDAPALSPKLRRQLTERLGLDVDLDVVASPVPFRRSRSTAEKVRAVREDREGARDRFSGLELFQDDGDFS